MTRQQNWVIVLRAAAVAGCCLTGWQSCHAQVDRFQPSSPTISPYLNLTRPNVGGLPNYFSLVRPQVQQQRFNQQQQTLLRQQDRQLMQMENNMQRGVIGPAQTGTGSWFMTPGNQTSFRDTGRFFPEPPGRGRR